MSDQLILFPTGRMVWGDLYKPEIEDYDGNPLIYKKGPKKGQPRADFRFGVAIPKTPGLPASALTLSPTLAAQGHTLESMRAQGWTDATLIAQRHATAVPGWALEPWGKLIHALATSEFPNGEALHADFSWKIADGDSNVLGKPFRGKPGRANKDKEGYAGNWIVTFSRPDFAPRIFNSDGTQQLLEPGVVKCGYFIQVYAVVKKNEGASPGIYINHDCLAYRAWGQEISTGSTDAASVGFGKDALPAGASVVPTGNVTLPAPTTTVLPPPAAIVTAALPPGPGAVAPPPPPTLVTPHTAILTLPAPGAVAPPPPPAEPQMTPAARAAGYTYAALAAANWTEAQMRQAGHIV